MPYRRGGRKGALRKRGFTVKARAGNWVPFIGGSSIEFQKRGLKAMVRRQALKVEETKKVITGFAALGLKHNTIYTCKLNEISQGTGIDKRTGDRVFYCGMNIKVQLTSLVPNQLVRMYVVRYRGDSSVLTTAANTLTGGIGASTLYRNADTAPTSFVNSDNITVIAAKTCKMDAMYSGDVQVRECRLNARIMKQFQFRTGGSQEGEHYNYYLVVHPFATSGSVTTGTTSVVDAIVSHEQVYKDA